MATRGFRGGKHLLELIRQELGSDVGIVLSHEESSLTAKRVVINFDAFRAAGQQRFFEVYRQTGIRAATSFLNEQFPETFTAGADDALPEPRDVKRVLRQLPERRLMSSPNVTARSSRIRSQRWWRGKGRSSPSNC